MSRERRRGARSLRAFAVLRRHSVLITRIGRILLIAVGLAVVSGLREQVMIQVCTQISGYTVPV